MNIKLTSPRIFLFVFSLVLLTSCKDKKNNETQLLSAIEYKCPMDCEDGKTYNEEGSCPVCKMDLKAIGHSTDCNCTKDGSCKCEDGKCSCENCTEHGNKTVCTTHKDGNCECLDDKCICENCPVHT